MFIDMGTMMTFGNVSFTVASLPNKVDRSRGWRPGAYSPPPRAAQFSPAAAGQ
jgi:hypothetical protein